MELEEFAELYGKALWYERREVDIMAAAIGKVLGGEKE